MDFYNDVGIDLPELIRLKQRIMFLPGIKENRRVGIDLPELIRLKPAHKGDRLPILPDVGIDLPELIRLKLKFLSRR